MSLASPAHETWARTGPDANPTGYDPRQLERNEAVDRIRRIQLNDLENVPFFLVAGFLYILTEPSLTVARLLLYGCVASRLAHFARTEP